MNEIFAKLQDTRIVPVIKLDKPEHARILGQALIDGELPVAEVTFRTAAAAGAIAILRKEFPRLLVGSRDGAHDRAGRCRHRGGRCLRGKPGFQPPYRRCLPLARPADRARDQLPRAQIELALERGLSVLKFFPAEASGGVKMLKALHGPYADVRFIPTGGIDAINLASYLALPYVSAVGGSWMVKEDLVAAGEIEELARRCHEAVILARAAR